MAQLIDPEHTLFLIDGSSFLYRAYYGLRPLHTPQGMPVQAVFSFCRMIKKLIDTFSPRYIAITWDSRGLTKRHEMYGAYKATREEPPSDLFQQKEKIIEFADLIGLAQVAQPAVEADDIMYSLAKDWIKTGGTALFITSDKDMGQAIGSHILMFDPFKDEIIDTAKFQEKMGFDPSKLPFFFGLVGDTSDNIPGVPGIGKKTATDLVQQFASLEDLYARIDEVKKAGTKKTLEEHKDKAFLSRDLFLLQYYAFNLTADDLAFDASRWKYARPLFEELNFKSLIAELGGTAQDAARSFEQKVHYLRDTYQLITVTTPEQLTALAHELEASDGFAVDTEGNCLNPLLSDLVGISLCTKPGVAYYVPLAHTTSSAQLPRELVDKLLKPIFENERIPKYLHHTKFDQLMFASNGIELRGVAFDTLIAANLVTRDWQRINLKELSSTYLQEEMLTFQEVVKQFKLPNFAHTDLDIATLYSAFDAHQTIRLMPLFQKMLEDEGMVDLFNKIEMPLSQVLYRMEKEGILLDVSIIKQLDVLVSKELETILAKLEPFMEDHAGPINLNSPKQVGELLFEKLKLPPKKKSSKGAYSTDQEVLAELAKIHPVPGMIITYRELFKLKSTYLDALPTYVNPRDGKIHTSYSQTSVATGRLASSDPNLQNIPASGYGLEIRTAFKPAPGNVFIAADYSQIELRVLAHLSQDKNLLNAFLHGHDIHAETAARLFDTPLDGVTHEQRQIGKRINFSILYGLTPYGLSQDLDISFKDAKLYIEKYFAQYPAVSEWMDAIVEQTKEKGYVQTFWGRRRYIPAIYEKNRALYEEARRVAINTVAQGTAAEIMKLGMIAVDKKFAQHYPQARMLLQIHDELLVSAPHEVSQDVESLVKSTLESVVSWSVPLVVSTRSGANWKEVSK